MALHIVTSVENMNIFHKKLHTLQLLRRFDLKLDKERVRAVAKYLRVVLEDMVLNATLTPTTD